MATWYAKVVVLTGTFAEYRDLLAVMAGPGVDVGVLQVGVHEALVRPHLLRHIRTKRPDLTPEQILQQAGAHAIKWIDEPTAYALYHERILEDMDPEVPAPPPPEAGGLAWHLQALKVQAAWDAIGPNPEQIDWQGIRIGQLDTGYTRHKAFGHGQPGGTWLADCRTFMPSLLPADLSDITLVPDDGVDPMPLGGLFRGHGTRVGATISGLGTDSNGFRFRGVAPRVPHVMVRISDSVALNNRQEEFAQGLRYLVDVAKVDVVNVSAGVFPPLAAPVMKEAVKYAHSKGVIVVCAAGNHIDPVVPPAALPETIAVAGITWQSLPWHGSAFGARVDFSGPAADVYRPEPRQTGISTGFASGGSGTSYAAACTTGSAALWLRRWKPQVDAKYGKTGARVEAFRQAAIASCRKPDGWQPTPFGAGILDTGKLCTQQAIALP